MKQVLFTITAVFLSFTTFSNLNAQNRMQTDSITITKIIEDFYSWYISSIKDHKELDYQPSFIEDKDGNTTLYFDNYLLNLKNYKFSDSLIHKEAISYSDCINKLATVKFSNFKKSEFVDLDEYEKYKCDFSNNYKWIGGQEICDGIKIDKLKFISKNKCEANVKKYSLTDDKKRFWWNTNIKVVLIRVYQDWKINSIVIK